MTPEAPVKPHWSLMEKVCFRDGWNQGYERAMDDLRKAQEQDEKREQEQKWRQGASYVCPTCHSVPGGW